MSQANLPPRASRTRLTSQGFVAICAAAVVLLLAFTFIGISQASSRLGVQGAGAPQLPPAKATLLAQGDATIAAARTQAAGQPKQFYPPPPAVPTATMAARIIHNAGQTKIPNFWVQDLYLGPVNGVWEVVYTGADTANVATGVGAIRVDTYSTATGSHQLVGVFDAPDHSTYISITGIEGNILRITSDKTASFGFDLRTNTYTS